MKQTQMKYVIYNNLLMHVVYQPGITYGFITFCMCLLASDICVSGHKV